MEMKLYDDFETGTSLKYLQKVAESVVEPVCLIGGWAVYYTVNKNFVEETKVNYLGSRDIDLGFYIGRDWNEEKVRNSSLVLTTKKLEAEGYEWVSSRLQITFDKNTGQLISTEKSKNTAEPFLFRLYVDALVNHNSPALRKLFHVSLYDEDLLDYAFEDQNNRVELPQFGNKIFMPSPPLLLATKLKALPNRTKDDKRVKDICDICALVMFSENIKVLKGELPLFMNKKTINSVIGLLSDDDYKKAGAYLGIGWEELKATVRAILQ